jgi:hypothetical protein
MACPGPAARSTPLTAFPEYREVFERQPALPEKVNIGLTSRCTLRCIMCHHALPGRSRFIFRRARASVR